MAISEIDGPIVRLELQVSGVYQCSLYFPDFVQTTKPKQPPTSTAIVTTLNTNDGSIMNHREHAEHVLVPRKL